MRAFDVYDHTRGVVVATVHAFTKASACTQVSEWSGVPIERLVAAIAS